MVRVRRAPGGSCAAAPAVAFLTHGGGQELQIWDAGAMALDFGGDPREWRSLGCWALWGADAPPEDAVCAAQRAAWAGLGGAELREAVGTKPKSDGAPWLGRGPGPTVGRALRRALGARLPADPWAADGVLTEAALGAPVRALSPAAPRRPAAARARDLGGSTRLSQVGRLRAFAQRCERRVRGADRDGRGFDERWRCFHDRGGRPCVAYVHGEGGGAGAAAEEAGAAGAASTERYWAPWAGDGRGVGDRVLVVRFPDECARWSLQLAARDKSDGESFCQDG